MTIEIRRNGTEDTERTPIAARAETGDGWRICEFVCDAGPGDRPFEERHDRVSLAVVTDGSFTYRSDTGRALMVPGSVLLGNAGRCFECGHDHGTGDRCIAFQLDRAYFEEIAARRAGHAAYAFATPALPPSDRLLPAAVAAAVAAAGAETLAREELVVAVAETVVALASGVVATSASPSARDMRRIGASLRRIEADADTTLDLATLAGDAGMSRYHYLRTFRRTVGTTPHQFVLATRMRRAAARLATSRDPVTAVAFDAGFGDLSTFVRRFRRIFGTTPSDYRRRETTLGAPRLTP